MDEKKEFTLEECIAVLDMLKKSYWSMGIHCTHSHNVDKGFDVLESDRWSIGICDPFDNMSVLVSDYDSLSTTLKKAVLELIKDKSIKETIYEFLLNMKKD